MISQYQTLLTVSLEHDYFANNQFSRFTLAPFAETADYMHKKGILLRVRGAAITLLADTGEEGDKLKFLLAEGYPLNFAINITDPDFLNYTDAISDALASSVYYFSSYQQEDLLPTDSALHQAAAVTGADTKPVENFAELFFKKPFGVLSLKLSSVVPSAYRINFKAKATYWKYIIVSEYLLDMDHLAVVDSQQQAFEGPEQAVLPNNQKALVFSSGQPIKLSERPAAVFSLVESYAGNATRYRVVKRSLPGPDVSRISAALTDTTTNSSEIFI
ncbi:hypothetical protein MUY27_01280 [Mucilaginibacter sp. RS28]|uniref:Uncharacterized protein n=1 Tax=Mucilaginibacter straminoryzae TaxID=2932774 RepID=A0A9X2B839_9SPHI|nr:hypothetical protein [Mucilaginibacter straminoryzae]MCJ8208320.1 hypothetical protein [Mucilaginibacter straminoryzae]